MIKSVSWLHCWKTTCEVSSRMAKMKRSYLATHPLWNQPRRPQIQNASSRRWPWPPPTPSSGLGYFYPGLVTNSILFCWLFTTKDRCKKCVFNKRTIKVCDNCCWRCPGISAPSAAHLTVSLYLCSSGSNARGESRAREGRCVSSKSPSRVRDGDEGVAGRNGRE